MDYLKSKFKIFPDFPHIRPNSKTSVFELVHLLPMFTEEQRNDEIEECMGLGIIEPCKYDEYVITSKGWELWNDILRSEA